MANIVVTIYVKTLTRRGCMFQKIGEPIPIGSMKVNHRFVVPHIAGIRNVYNLMIF